MTHRETKSFHFVAFLIVGLLVPATIAHAQTPSITAAPSVVAAGPDYATDVLANPWDFSDPLDVSPFPDELGGWTISSTTARTVGRSAFLDSGQFVGRTTPTGSNLVPLLFRGGADFLTSEQESSGVFDHKTIRTGAYGKLAVAMTLSASTSGQLAAYWYGTPYGAPNPTGQGVAFRTPQAGTHIYIVDLVTGVWTDARGNPVSPIFLPIGGMGAAPWSATPLVRGFQLRPTSSAAQVDVAVDWVRITQRDGAAGAATLPITFSGCAGRDYNVEVMAPGGAWEVIHTGTASAASTTTAFVNHGVLPPGSWAFRVACFPTSRAPGGGTPATSTPVSVTINAPPVTTVHNPDATGGADYATTVRGNAWDMNSLSDIAQQYGIVNPAIVVDGSTTAFQGTSTSSGDPALIFVYGQTIDTSRFRHLTFTLTLDTPFALAPPGGSVARVFFERLTSAGSTLSVSQDILVWPGRNIYTIDLAALTQPTGLDPDCACPNVPWAASPVRYFRIDPHESSLGVTFRLGPVWLTAHDEVAVNGTFDIQYSFSDSDAAGSSYLTRVYLDTDRDPSSKVLLDTITSGVVPHTPLTYRFSPSGIPAGDYLIYIEVTESRAGITDTRGYYSTGPLRVTTGSTGPTAPGAPSLVPVQTSSNPVTIAWTPGTGGAPTSYTVVAGTGPGASNLAVINVGLLTQVSGSVPPGVPIYVRVVASNAVGSAVSNEIGFVVNAGPVPPGRPTLAPATVSGQTVALSWAASGGGPPSYFVLIARLPGNPNPIVTFPTAQTSAVFNGVPFGTYVVSVVAVNAAGASAESAPILVTVP